jgi:hypothetical protein
MYMMCLQHFYSTNKLSTWSSDPCFSGTSSAWLYRYLKVVCILRFYQKTRWTFFEKIPIFWALLSDFEDTHKHGIYCYNKFRHKYQYNMSKGRIPSLYFFEFLFSRLFKGIFHHKNTYYFRTNSNCFYSIRY